MKHLQTDWRSLSREMGAVSRLLLSLTLLVSLVLTCHADCCWDSDGFAIDGKEVINRQDDPFWKPLLSSRCDCNPGTECPYGENDGLCSTRKTKSCVPAPGSGGNQTYCVQDIIGCVIPGSGARYEGKYCRDYDFLSETYCLDGTQRVGSYCGAGKCNMFGCDCDGGCKKPGGKRKLMQAKADTSPVASPDDDSSDLPGSSGSNLVGQCQEKMVDKYKTTSLQDPEQIKAYFDCLDTDGNGLLNLDDATVKNASLDASNLNGMDSDGNGGIDPGELDSDLDASPSPLETTSGALSGAPSTARSSRVGGAFGVTFLAVMCLVA